MLASFDGFGGVEDYLPEVAFERTPYSPGELIPDS
jgi:hypothetical protein